MPCVHPTPTSRAVLPLTPDTSFLNEKAWRKVQHSPNYALEKWHKNPEAHGQRAVGQPSSKLTPPNQTGQKRKKSSHGQEPGTSLLDEKVWGQVQRSPNCAVEKWHKNPEPHEQRAVGQPSLQLTPPEQTDHKRKKSSPGQDHRDPKRSVQLDEWIRRPEAHEQRACGYPTR